MLEAFYSYECVVCFVFHRRIRRREATERFSAPAHTPLASALRQTAAAELVKQAQAHAHAQTVYNDDVEMKVEGQPHQHAPHTHQQQHQLPGHPQVPGRDTAGASAGAGTGPRTEAPVAHYSSLHTLSGFLDVGSDALFKSEKAWLHAASQAVVGEKSKTN